jgi:hypothetical protein
MSALVKKKAGAGYRFSRDRVEISRNLSFSLVFACGRACPLANSWMEAVAR